MLPEMPRPIRKPTVPGSGVLTVTLKEPVGVEFVVKLDILTKEAGSTKVVRPFAEVVLGS